METKVTCLSCVMLKNGYCTVWKQKIDDLKIAETCKKFSTVKVLNKGLQIRKNKLDKKARKRAEIKPEQENLVRFVAYKENVVERINGKYRHPSRVEYGQGLQIQNKIYLPNGKYKMVNRTNLKITKSYKDVPEWANEYLQSMYKEKSQMKKDD